MAERKSARKSAQGFTAEERAAMKERARELKAEKNKADGESDLLAKIVCFFQSAAKFKSRYATFGFNDTAKLDDGAMWPTSFALRELGDAEEKKIRALVKKAVR